MHPTKISPAIAALLTDEYLSGLSYRELERRHPGLSRSRIAVHVKRELQRRAQGEIEAKIERRAIARHRAQARAAAEANLPAGVRRKLAGQFYLHGEAGLLDERDFMGNLRAQRIKERGLHPVHASNFAVDCDDQEWADYLAGRDTWPPHVDASKATRRWKLGTSRQAGGREQAMTTIHDSNERTTTAVTVRAERARFSEHGDEWADNLQRNHGPFRRYDQTVFGQTPRVFDQGGDELARQQVRTV